MRENCKKQLPLSAPVIDHAKAKAMSQYNLERIFKSGRVAVVGAEAGHPAFVSQSGAICMAVLYPAFKEHIGFSHFVSIGAILNRCTLNPLLIFQLGMSGNGVRGAFSDTGRSGVPGSADSWLNSRLEGETP